MIFTGLDNQTVEFVITNYEFPNNTEGDWDGNWLNIYLKVKSKVGDWQTIDPSLTTWEVQELIDWFETFSTSGQTEYLKLQFTEPNLSFELVESKGKTHKMFRIMFNLESRPKSAENDKEYFVDFSADSQELKRIADELRMELDKYPER